MSTDPLERDDRPIAGTDELVEQFRAACKPRGHWRVGTESEMIGVYDADPGLGEAPPYEGERGIGAMLARIQCSEWTPMREGDTVIGLSGPGASITLEPGGQLELAARPVESSSQFASDLEIYERVVADASRELGIAWLGLGFRPFGTRDDVPWMPKKRYAIMREYLPTRGSLAHDMMKRTATVQVNVDYADEDDAAAKLKCAMSITSILTALYANSPIVDGAVSEYQSYRSAVWLDVDPDRCGLLPLAFEDGDLFRRYVEYALDVPMFFVARRGAYSPARGTTFRRFLADGFEGERATLNDWEIHLSTLFSEARIKRFMEVRGCDGGSHAMIVALGPLCLGLLYDDAARADATALTAGLSFGEREQLARDVCTGGLSARVAGRNHTLGDLARQLVDIAADGLSRVAPDEAGYLEPVRAIAQTGRTQADAVVDAWNAAGGDVAAAISSFRRFA